MGALADTTTLSWITAEVDQALERVRQIIAKFEATPGDAAVLGACPEHLHQVSGALNMVGLSEATQFCETLEGSFANLDASPPSIAAVGVIGRGVLALKQYVDGLAHGEPNVPVRLYPAYRELAGLQGKADCAEKDLFFPDLTPPASAHPNPRALEPAELPAFLQAQRMGFQRGLLAWLLHRPGGLEDMCEALDAMHSVAMQLPERRALWWVAAGLMDALHEANDAEWLARAKALCKKLDFQIRDLAAGSRAVNDPLMRELLYAIACSSAGTQRLKDVRRIFGLDQLIPAAESSAPDLDSLQPAIEDARSRLQALKGAWQQYLMGEAAGAVRFREITASLQEKASRLLNPHFTRMLDAIALAGAKLPDPRPDDDLVIEMSAAFMLAEYILERFGKAPEDLEAQVRILSAWLTEAAAGKSADTPPAGLRAEFTQQISAMQLRAQVAREIVANLQHVEQVLDAYARGTAARDTLPALAPQLRQIHGALAVLRLERASEVLATCDAMIHAPGEIDMDWIAEGLSSLGFYLEPCLQGREPREQAIDFFLERFQQRAAPQPQHRAPTPAPQDEGLLQIFLEEATEVLASIEAALPICRAEPGNAEALATIRRGFHTLKGSGRMVGLDDLGEVAWEVEQVMNRWLEDKQPASAELLELVAAAANRFADWVTQLKQGQPIAVDVAAITALARKLDAHEPEQTVLEPEQTVLEPEQTVLEPEQTILEPEQAVLEPEQTILESEQTVLEPEQTILEPEQTILEPEQTILAIYLNEAAGHVATLVAQYKPASAVSDEFIRAAHTLAGSSRTAGFAAVADLAAALEQWTPFADRVVQPAEVALVGAVIDKLKSMVAALQRGEASGDAGEALGAMQQMTARFKVQRVMRDDIDEHLLPVFLEEAEELVPQIGSDLRDWRAQPEDPRIADALKRALHTLKGSARMAGAIRLGELTHLMESQVETALAAGRLPPELFDELESKMDRLSVDLDRMKEHNAPAPAPAAIAEPPLPGAAAMLRVNADTLDFLITESGEVAIARSRIEAELRQVKQALGDLADSIARLRTQLREVEIQADSQMQSRRSVLDERDRDFDPLEFDRYTRLQELTRMMAEGLNDATSIQQALLKNLDETDAALLQQTRIGRELQQDLMRMRAVPFATLSERLHRVVRQTAREIGRKAELAIQGAQIELDRGVIEHIAAPLEHMLRNAVAHGVEDPRARSAAGKPETARITIELRQEANEIVIILADDGTGLDVQKLRSKAVEKGLLAADRELSEPEQNQLVFLTGLSTVDAVTELAGRGVGMDVVRTEIAAVNGRIDIASSRGTGTTFTIFVPLTLAVTQTVMVQAGVATLAISSATVEQVLRLKADAMATLYEKRQVEFQGRVYPLHSLRQLLGERAAVEIQDYNSVLLLRSGIQRVAVHVDKLLGNQEIVVKNIGPQLSRIAGVTGATVLADGRIVLIVNPVQLAQRKAAAGAWLGEITGVIGARASTPLVMVVDDSLTVRKFTSRLLEREGYRVVTAKDGLDAIEKLKDRLPEVMLVDIEMPRMDGFDLTRIVRGDPRTVGIPIIVISSRTAEKHRSRAAALGVNAFIGKPYPETELLEHISACLRRP
jgi:chemosensory pili system protein ChpA (sensor histidine kinase/response regulator)